MIRPLADRIVVEAQQPEQVSLGGIVLPPAQEKPQTGKVIAIGDDLYTHWMPDKAEHATKSIGMGAPVKVGDTVLFTKYSGTDVEHDGHQYKLMKIGDVLGVIE